MLYNWKTFSTSSFLYIYISSFFFAFLCALKSEWFCVVHMELNIFIAIIRMESEESTNCVCVYYYVVENIMQKMQFFFFKLSTIQLPFGHFFRSLHIVSGNLWTISFLLFFSSYLCSCAHAPLSEILYAENWLYRKSRIPCTHNALCLAKHSHRSGLSFRNKKSIDKRAMQVRYALKLLENPKWYIGARSYSHMLISRFSRVIKCLVHKMLIKMITYIPQSAITILFCIGRNGMDNKKWRRKIKVVFSYMSNYLFICLCTDSW